MTRPEFPSRVLHCNKMISFDVVVGQCVQKHSHYSSFQKCLLLFLTSTCNMTPLALNQSVFLLGFIVANETSAYMLLRECGDLINQAVVHRIISGSPSLKAAFIDALGLQPQCFHLCAAAA